MSRALLGDGLFALRLPVALAGALLALGVGLLARRLGASRVGQGLACGALLSAPLFQIMFGFFSMNAFEIVLWGALLWIAIEVELKDAPRMWLLFGGLAGLALLNKHTVVTLAVALGAGLVASPARRHLSGRWLWLGALLAALLVLPNLLWQVEHGWPSLEFYRNAALQKQVRLPPLQVLLTQLVFVNPGTLPI